jgi:hypothetical protein
MSNSINTTTIMSASNNNKYPLAFDHDSQKLTIIFGILTTLIALFGLVLAALTWYTPRQRLSDQLRASDEYDLESNPAQREAPVAQDSSVAADTEPKYARTRLWIERTLADSQ